MSYYNKCPDCGANLDPGEACDCTGKKNAAEETAEEKLDRASREIAEAGCATGVAAEQAAASMKRFSAACAAVKEV